MSCVNEFSSSPTQTYVSQGNWMNTRKRGRDDVEITAAAETADIASAEKRRRRASNTPTLDIGDVEHFECARNKTSTTQITNQLNKVQELHREMRLTIRELIYIVQSQKAEIQLCRRKIDNIGLAANVTLTRGDVVSENSEVNIEQGTIDNLDINSEKEDRLKIR